MLGKVRSACVGSRIYTTRNGHELFSRAISGSGYFGTTLCCYHITMAAPTYSSIHLHYGRRLAGSFPQRSGRRLPRDMSPLTD